MTKIQRVQPGQPLAIPARAYNAFADAAEAFTDGLVPTSERLGRRVPGQVALRNVAGADMAAHELVLVDVTIGTPSLDGFSLDVIRASEAAASSDPIDPTDPARVWALTLQPIAQNATGPGTLRGPVMVEVDDMTTGDRIIQGSGVLELAFGGPGFVLWEDQGFAMVMIGVPEARRRARIESSVELPVPNQWSYGVRAPGGFDEGATNRWGKINGSSGVQGIGRDLDADAPGGSSLELLPAPDGLEVEVLSRWDPVSGEVLHEFQFPNPVKATCL